MAPGYTVASSSAHSSGSLLERAHDRGLLWRDVLLLLAILVDVVERRAKELELTRAVPAHEPVRELRRHASDHEAHEILRYRRGDEEWHALALRHRGKPEDREHGRRYVHQSHLARDRGRHVGHLEAPLSTRRAVRGGI